MRFYIGGTYNSKQQKRKKERKYTIRRAASEFKLFRLLRGLSNSSIFSLFISPFHHPATRSFFLTRRDHFKAALASVPAASTFLPFSCIWPARHARACSFFIRTNRSESPRRNGINSRFTDLLARRSSFLFKRFTHVLLFSPFLL